MTTSDKSVEQIEQPSQVASQQEVLKLKQEVRVLREQLRHTQRLAAVGTMAAMVAHEFNNLLTPVINYAQMAKRNPALVPKAIERAADGGKRAAEISRAILGMARGDKTGIEPVELGGLVRQTLLGMARDPQKDAIELVLETPEAVHVLARRVEIQQVILNMILNARQAVLKAPKPRRIHIRIVAENAKALMVFEDTGVGIEPEDIARIFLPFYSTAEDKDEKLHGHGLGLTVCLEIVKAMGGDIHVRSTPGQGSCFTVEIPLNQA
jgi:signal transduction histidine kinase